MNDPLAHSPTRSLAGIDILGDITPQFAEILTPEALAFVADLEREFGPTRAKLLKRRIERQEEIKAGKLPAFLAETQDIRDGDWKVAEAPKDLDRRHAEITGPCERKMMINALNSGADVFMADLEDALSPTWANVVEGQINLRDAVRGTLGFTSPEGKEYKLGEKTATLLVRPRGWHLVEKHVKVDGEPVSASLFDFGLYFFHNACERLERGTGPYFYLPKLESHLEARLWNDVFNFAQDTLQVPRGSVRATVLIETILAAFEMEEILYELRDHSAGLNAGRWDYIFSLIKKFHHRADLMLPDRAQVTMTVPFMRAYTELLVKACHRRGAHAIGGMAAFIPSRKDPEVNEIAFAKVREDKEREAGDGFDGTWVAHPGLVPLAQEVFAGVLGKKPHQKDRQGATASSSSSAGGGAQLAGPTVAPGDLLDLTVPGGKITEAGVRLNVNVALQYLDAWLGGWGAAAIFNLMEDTATAEISRAQLWQWVHHEAKLDDGRGVTKEFYNQVREEELTNLGGPTTGHLKDAVEVLDALVLEESFIDFLTHKAYGYLDGE